MKLSISTKNGQNVDQFSSLCGEIPDRVTMSDQVQPGGTVTGNLCFEVPTAAADGSVLLAAPLFTTDEVKDQEFLALT